jgi:DNA polymerase III alpha subunit
MLNFTHYSVGYGISHIDELVKRAAELNLPYLTITDLNSLAGCPEFLETVNKVNEKRENKIVPILGATFTVKLSEGHGHLSALCKNKQGWHSLLKILSTMQVEKQEFFELKDVLSNLTNLDIILGDFEGRAALAKILGEKGIPFTETNVQSNYVRVEDKILHQVVLSGRLDCTIPEIPQVIEKHKEFAKFFGEDTFALTTSANLNLSGFSPFSLKAKPFIPNFSLEGRSYAPPEAAELLKNLCRDGWASRKLNWLCRNDPALKDVYLNRIKEELKTFEEANLSSYFLIVKDLMNYSRENGYSCGLRGSGSGCLIAYLIGISDIDPIWPDKTIPYDPNKSLLFSRFYNSARNSAENISLPDLDIDVCPSFRQAMKQYIVEKYGSDKVASYIVTYARYDGKGAFKQVCRALGTLTPEEVNDITKFMIDYARIQDELEDLKQEDPKYNTLRYNLDHVLAVQQLYEEYKEEFDLAVRISDTIYSRSKHAAGVVISPNNLNENFPIFIEKDGTKILGLEMEWAEYVGALKYDLLCVAAYEKIDKIIEMINTGSNEPVVGILEEDTE